MADKVRHGLNVKPAEHFWNKSIIGGERECVECGDRAKVNSFGLCIDCRNAPAVKGKHLG